MGVFVNANRKELIAGNAMQEIDVVLQLAFFVRERERQAQQLRGIVDPRLAPVFPVELFPRDQVSLDAPLRDWWVRGQEVHRFLLGLGEQSGRQVFRHDCRFRVLRAILSLIWQMESEVGMHRHVANHAKGG